MKMLSGVHYSVCHPKQTLKAKGEKRKKERRKRVGAKGWRMGGGMKGRLRGWRVEGMEGGG